MSIKGIEYLIREDYSILHADLSKQYVNEDLFNSVAHDYINIPSEIYKLKSKTLSRKNIGFTQDSDKQLLNEFIESNGDFFAKLNLYIEAFGQIVLKFTESKDDKHNVLVDILSPYSFKLVNDKVYEIIETDDDEKLLKPTEYLVIGSEQKPTTLYARTLGINEVLIDLNCQIKYQAFSVPVVTGLDEGEDNKIILGANRMIRFSGFKESNFEFVSPDSKIKELLDALYAKIILVCRSENIPEDYLLPNQRQGDESGYAIKLRNEPLTQYYDERFPYLLNCLYAFFTAYNQFAGEKSLRSFSETVVVTDKIHKDILTYAENIQIDNFLLKLNLMDKIDVVQKYIGCTEQEAIEYIKKREARSEYRVEDTVANKISQMLE